jgi:Ca2+-transporting ATPase
MAHGQPSDPKLFPSASVASAPATKSPQLALATGETSWHCLETQEVLGKLGVEAAIGLRGAEAEHRLTEFGRNELLQSGMKSSWLILWEQLKALMVLILIAAAIVSVLLGDYRDTIAIGTIVVLNALLGFFEEYRAEKAMVALKKLTVPASKVRRDGEMHEVPAIGLVPGDIVVLEAGSLVRSNSLMCPWLTARTWSIWAQP